MADFDTLPIDSADQFETWLAEHGSRERQVWIEIHKKSSGRQTVGFDELLDMAICYGWIDVQTKGLDDFR
ncbi:MAG: YdeI family protein [Thermomicrobiales bacterium]